jgi:hypothetical protein
VQQRLEEETVKGPDAVSVGQAGGGGSPGLPGRDLEARVAELERQVVTLTAAVDAASRMRIATPFRLNTDVRIAGGRAVRRILEKGRLVLGYAEGRRTE